MWLLSMERERCGPHSVSAAAGAYAANDSHGAQILPVQPLFRPSAVLVASQAEMPLGSRPCDRFVMMSWWLFLVVMSSPGTTQPPRLYPIPSVA